MSTPPTVQIDFTGTVSAESAQGETVTCAVTYADGTAGPSVTGQTVDDGLGTPTSITFQTAKGTYNSGQGLSVVASIPDDSADGAAVSAPFKFDALTSRTIAITAAVQ